MKKQVILLMLVMFALVSCSIWENTDTYEMEHFDKAACISVDNGLYTGKTLFALTDPYFLDDKNVDALMLNATDDKIINTKITAQIVNGDANRTVAFATIENYYDSISTIELYLNKTDSVVSSMLTGQSFDEVIITDDIETEIAATFSTINSTGAEQIFNIPTTYSNMEFYTEAVRCLYGKTGNIPVLEVGEKRYRVTCQAIEVMSLYSYVDITTEDEYTFYFDEHMSMRVWDEDGVRVPMKDNSINWTMAAEFGGRGDGGSGEVVAKIKYDLPVGRYFVRWLRAESTKSSGQFATTPEGIENYFKFSVGIFNSMYTEDAETRAIVDKLFAPTVTKALHSCYQCDSTLWGPDEQLSVTDLLRNADKMNALLSGLDIVTTADMNKGIKFTFEKDLPQGIFILDVVDMEDVDTLRVFLDRGAITMYKRIQDFDTGGKKFNPFTANVTGVTFKELFVSADIDKVIYMYNFDENLYLMTVSPSFAGEDINMIFVK